MPTTSLRGPRTGGPRDPAWFWLTSRLNFNVMLNEGFEPSTTGPLDRYSHGRGVFNNPGGDVARGSWFSNSNGSGIRLSNAPLDSGSSSNVEWNFAEQYGLYAALNPDTRSPHFTVAFTYRAQSWPRESAQTLVELSGLLEAKTRISISSTLSELQIARPAGATYAYSFSAEQATAIQTRPTAFVVAFVDGGGVAAWIDGQLIGFSGPAETNGNVVNFRLGRTGLKEQTGPDGEYGCAFIYNGVLTMAHRNAVRWSADPYGWTRPFDPGKFVLRPHGPFDPGPLARIPSDESVGPVAIPC